MAEDNRLWWVLGAILIVIAIFYYASTAVYGGPGGIFSYFGAQYQAPTPVSAVSGRPTVDKPGFDWSNLLWLLLIPLLLALLAGLWKGRGLLKKIRRPAPAAIALELTAHPQQIGFNQSTWVKARILKNGQPMSGLHFRKIKFELLEAPADISLGIDPDTISRQGESLKRKIDSSKYARIKLRPGGYEGNVKIKASWSSRFYGDSEAICDVTISAAPSPTPGVGHFLDFEADKYTIPSDGSSVATLTATVTDALGRPLSGEDVSCLIESFHPLGGQVQKGGSVDFQISSNGVSLSTISGARLPLLLRTDRNGKAVISLTAGFAKGTARICAIQAYLGNPPLKECLNIGIGVTAPLSYSIKLSSSPSLLNAEGGHSSICGEIYENGSSVAEPLIFTISQQGGTDAYLVDSSGSPCREVRAIKDPSSGFAIAILVAGKRSGDVTIKAVLEKDKSVSAETKVKIDIAKGPRFSLSVSADPLLLEAEGQISRITARLAGNGSSVAGKEIGFSIVKRWCADDTMLLDRGVPAHATRMKTDANGLAIAELRVGRRSGKVQVYVVLEQDRAVNASVEVELDIKKKIARKKPLHYLGFMVSSNKRIYNNFIKTGIPSLSKRSSLFLKAFCDNVIHSTLQNEKTVPFKAAVVVFNETHVKEIDGKCYIVGGWIYDEPKTGKFHEIKNEVPIIPLAVVTRAYPISGGSLLVSEEYEDEDELSIIDMEAKEIAPKWEKALEVMNKFERQGVPVAPSLSAKLISADKWLTHKYLSQFSSESPDKYYVPKTILAKGMTRESLEALKKQVDSKKGMFHEHLFVLKPRKGSHGKGIFPVDSVQDCLDAFNRKKGLKIEGYDKPVILPVDKYMVQEYIMMKHCVSSVERYQETLKNLKAEYKKGEWKIDESHKAFEHAIYAMSSTQIRAKMKHATGFEKKRWQKCLDARRIFEDSYAYDLRVLLCGGRGIIGYKRCGAPGSIKSNIHAGGEPELIKSLPSYRLCNIIYRGLVSASHMYLKENNDTVFMYQRSLWERIGIDLSRSYWNGNIHPILIEVNTRPGLIGVYDTGSTNSLAVACAEAIVKIAARFYGK